MKTRCLLITLGAVALPTAPLTASAQVERYEVGVNGMACPFCAYGIEKKLGGLDGVASMKIRIKDAEVDVVPSPRATITPSEIELAVDKAGFALRELKMTGTGTVVAHGDGLAIRFAPGLVLPAKGRGLAGRSGRLTISGAVVREGRDWTLQIAHVETP